jgi:hypothetical protein
VLLFGEKCKCVFVLISVITVAVIALAGVKRDEFIKLLFRQLHSDVPGSQMH